MAWLPFLQSEGIKPKWEDRYDQLNSDKKSSSTITVEKDSDDDENLEEEIDEEGRYDVFELDD